MIKIWGRTDSSNVQKVLWCCGELDLQFERLDWGGKFGGNKDPEYAAMNPNGLVPTIKDGDFVLWESNSIMRYLNAKYGNGKLLPASPEGMASANRWMDWQLSVFNPVIVPLFFATIRTPPAQRDPQAIQAALDKTVRTWQMVEDHLAKNRFLGGTEFSLGDIPLGVWAYRWFNLPIDRPEQPNIERWYDTIKQRKPYQTHIMIPVT
ncbi:MAG TPA: glutathione S-transferase family protein [Candidatus Binatia bacterium]|jgi:glutathione S-transferase|nr:glutathione S-transferase family protein [Candidatus Binatia bacterium]